MSPHADILDERESLRNPFFASLLFHGGVIFLLIGWNAYTASHKLTIGAPNPGYGNAVAVNSVRAIPLPPKHGRLNPVANDTENQVPQRVEPKPQPRPRQPPPQKNAISLKSRVPEKPQQHDYLLQKYRAQPLHPNQVTSSEAPAAVMPMYQKPGTTAGVGISSNSVLGNRFGAYAQALMEAIGRHWNTNGLAGVQAPISIVNVDILRDGSIRNPRIAQGSGNITFDRSALRAVTEAAPLPPLPPDYSGSYLNVDFQFQLHP